MGLAPSGPGLEQGRLKKRQRRRIMSYPLVIRLMIGMALMPDASYCEALTRLAGLLADIPFTREWHVPTGKVVTDWRLPVPPDVTESIFWQAAGPLIGGGEPSAVLLAGMMVLAAEDNRHRKTPGHCVRARLLLAAIPGTAVRKEGPPPHAGPRIVEPHATPAAARGRNNARNPITPSKNRLKERHGTQRQ